MSEQVREMLGEALREAECECGHPAEWHTGLIGCNADEWEKPTCPCRHDWLDAVMPIIEQTLAAMSEAQR